MTSTRLTWIAAALFLLCGLPLLVVEDLWWGRFWGGLAVLWLGVFALAMARAGVTTGQVRMNFSVIRRASQPRTAPSSRPARTKKRHPGRARMPLGSGIEAGVT